MRSAAKRIVQDGDITRLQIESLSRVSHRQWHRAQVHRHVIAHRDRLAFGIVNGTRIVAPFFDVGRV